MSMRPKVSLLLTVTFVGLFVLSGALIMGATAGAAEDSHSIGATNAYICRDCHSLHGAQSEGLGREASINETCFACHDGTSGYDIAVLYESIDTYAGHKTESEGSEPAGTQIDCVNCHTPHALISQNRFLMRSLFFAENETTKGLEPSLTRDFRDICVICHEIDASAPRTFLLEIVISNLATDTVSEIAHRPDETVYCKNCHNLGADVAAAHSPTLMTSGDTTEAESINIAGVDTTDTAASAEEMVVISGDDETTTLEWTGAGLSAGTYRILLRAQVESTATTFTGRINSADGTTTYPVTVDAWEYVNLGDFTINSTTDDFRLKVHNSAGTTSKLDRVYFLDY